VERLKAVEGLADKLPTGCLDGSPAAERTVATPTHDDALAAAEDSAAEAVAASAKVAEPAGAGMKGGA
jgi:hypothetical protein